MESLTTFDAEFLEVEDADSHANLAIGALAVMEGSLPDHASLLGVLAERAQTVRRSKQVLHRYPYDLGAPRWVDVDFEVSHHIHRTAVPHPGDDQALFGLIADVMSWRLHRDRPLWECWIVEGLSDDRWAILMKIHPSIADGPEATRVLMRLADEGEAIAPTQRGTELPNFTLNPLKWVGGMWRSSVALAATAARVLEGAIDITGGLVHPAPSPFTGRVTSVRRYASVEVGLEDVAKVCRAFDVTIKDVALAAMSDSCRALLMRDGEQPQRNSLRALVPTSPRSSAAIAIPVDQSDPVQQLLAVHERLTNAKEHGLHRIGSTEVSAADVVPFPLLAWAVRALARLPQRGVVALATNESGPRRRLRVMGRDVVRLLPIPAIGVGLRAGVAMVSYDDKLAFGVTADYDAVPRVGDLAHSIEQAVARLVAISTSAPRRSNRKGMLYLMPSEPVPTTGHGRQHNLARRTAQMP